MKTAIKFVSNFFKETQGDSAWTVVSFNKATGRREHAYLGHDFFNAFCIMSQDLAKGFDVILTDKKGADFMNGFEIRNLGSRVTYKMMMPYAIRVSESGSIYDASVIL